MGALLATTVSLYLFIGLIQMIAMASGMQSGWGLHWLWSALIALCLAFIPVVGALTGTAGAVVGWDWSITGAVSFFFPPYAVYLIAALTVGFRTGFRRL